MPPEFRPRRFAYSVLLSALSVIVLATHVHCGFERHRFRLVTAPVAAQSADLAVGLPDVGPLALSPAAVILRVRNGAEPLRLALAVDGEPFDEVSIAASGAQRVDAVATFPPGEGHRLVLSGDHAGWQLEYLEIANVHGFSRGVVDFVIVPRERPVERPLPIWLLVPLPVALALLQPRGGFPQRRWLRLAYSGLCGIVLVFFAGLLLAGALTPYRILLAPDTAVLLLALLYAEPLARGARRFWGSNRGWIVPAADRVWTSRAARVVRPVLPHLVAGAVFLGSVAQFYEPGVGFTSLVKFGVTFDDRTLPVLKATPHAVELTPGYDGQFYAQLALDPLLRTEEIRTALDAPAYRARRILMPWAAWLLGGGSPWWVLQAYALLNVACWVALGWVLLHWLPPGSLRPTLAWVACLFSHGLLTSVREAVPDGPSLLLLALAIRAVEAGRQTGGAGVLGLAGLCRETNVLGAAILIPTRLRAGAPSAAAAARMLLAIAPLAAWLWYLWSIDLPMHHTGARNLAMPFTSYAWKWASTTGELASEGWASFARLSLLSLVSLTTQAAFLLLHRRWNDRWWRTGVVYLGLMVVLGRAVWEGHPGAVTRVVLPMTVAFNILVLESRWFWALWVLGNLGVIAGLEAIHAPVFGPGKSWMQPFG